MPIRWAVGEHSLDCAFFRSGGRACDCYDDPDEERMKRYTPAPPKKPKTPSTPEEIAATKAAILKNMRSNRKRPSPADKGQEE